VSDVRTYRLVWRVGVKGRLFFDHTRRSYGMVIGDDFLGAAVWVRPPDVHRAFSNVKRLTTWPCPELNESGVSLGQFVALSAQQIGEKNLEEMTRKSSGPQRKVLQASQSNSSQSARPGFLEASPASPMGRTEEKQRAGSTLMQKARLLESETTLCSPHCLDNLA